MTFFDVKWQFFQEKKRIFRCENIYFSKISKKKSVHRCEMTIFSKIKKNAFLDVKL